MTINSAVLDHTGVIDASNLPSMTNYGSYPLFYLSSWHNVLCAECAKRMATDDPYEEVASVHINYEDVYMHCDNCGEQIPSAYGDD